MTVESILQRQYGARHCFTVHGETGRFSYEHFEQMEAAERSRYRVIKGHMRWGLHARMDGPVQYLTMLRDPVRRVVSQYQHILRMRDQVHHHRVVSAKMGLAEYVESGINPRASNGQVQDVAGIRKGGLEYSSTDMAVVETAWKNVTETFAPIGLTERFADSILVWRDRFSWNPPYYYRRNVTPTNMPGSNPTADELAVVARANRLDIELYDRARQQLDTAVRSGGRAFVRRKRSFLRRNRAYGKLLAFGKDVRYFGSIAWKHM